MFKSLVIKQNPPLPGSVLQNSGCPWKKVSQLVELRSVARYKICHENNEIIAHNSKVVCVKFTTDQTTKMRLSWVNIGKRRLGSCRPDIDTLLRIWLNLPADFSYHAEKERKREK